MSDSSTSASPSPWIYAKLIAVTAMWGGTFTAGRIVSSNMPPLTGAAMRFWIAVIGLIALMLLTKSRFVKLTKTEILGTAALGFTGIFLYNLGFFYVLKELPAGRTSLLVSLNPIVTLLGAVLLMGEKLTVMRMVGVLLAFGGVFVVLSRGDPASLLGTAIGTGELIMFGAVCSWAAYSLIGKKMLNTLSPLVATTYAASWGALFLTIAAILFWQPLPASAQSWPVAASLIFLGLFGTVVAFIWYYEGIKAIGASKAAVFNNLVPVFGVLQAALFLGEPILISMVIGGLITISGVVLANSKSR